MDKALKAFLRKGGVIEVCPPRKLKGSKTFGQKAANSASGVFRSSKPAPVTASFVYKMG